jgi:di/tricarboxylate transporter
LTLVREIIDALRDEIKAVLREYVRETKTALKKRLQRLLIISIIGSVLLSLVISLIGSAALFLLIGQLKYLETFVPSWEAWDIMGLTSGVIAGLLFLMLFIIIRKQLRSPEPSTTKQT